MTAVLVVVAPTYAEAQAAMAGRTDKPAWRWAPTLRAADNLKQRSERWGARETVTIMVAGERKAVAAA